VRISFDSRVFAESGRHALSLTAELFSVPAGVQSTELRTAPEAELMIHIIGLRDLRLIGELD